MVLIPGSEIIKLLLDAGKIAIDMVTGIKKKKEEDKKKASELFDHIGKLLHETYVELKKGKYPHGHCRQIEVFGGEIKSGYKKILGEAEAKKLGDLLIIAHEVERLHHMLGTGEVNKKELIKIEESSGEFLAASKLILF